MRALTFRKPLAPRAIRAVLGVIVAVAGLSLVGSTASAAPVAISLCASDGSITMPDAVSVPVWGFVQTGSCAAGLVNDTNFPGPPLVVNAGDVVTITIANALPAGHSPVLDVPGVTFAAGGTAASQTFTPAAGTYLVTSSGDVGRQQAMGLYVALIVRPATAGQAYDPATTVYDVEAPLVLSQVDPLFNAAPDTFNMHAYRASYWMINGKAYPATAGITAAAGQRVLLRYVNAGYDNTSMMLLGMHERVLARDARLLNNAFDANAEVIPAGGTEDAIATVPAGGAPSANGFALYNRQLHLTNGVQGGTSPSPSTGGGMLTFIHP